MASTKYRIDIASKNVKRNLLKYIKKILDEARRGAKICRNIEKVKSQNNF